MRINNVASTASCVLTNKGQRIALPHFVQVQNDQLEVHHTILPLTEHVVMDYAPCNHVRKVLVVLLVACRFHFLLWHN
jgi:hypothetical protein